MPAPTEFFTPGGIRGPESTDPRYETWLDDGTPAAPGAPIGTRVYIYGRDWKLPLWTKAVVGFSLAGLLGSTSSWLRPTLRATKQVEQPDGIWGWLTAALAGIKRFLDQSENYVAHEVSKGAAHAAAAPAQTLTLMAHRWNQLSWNLAYFVHDMELVVGRIVHTIIPREINKQTRPLRAEAKRLKVGLATTSSDLDGLRHWTHTQINTNVKPRIGRVEAKVNHTIPQQIRSGQRVATRTNNTVRHHSRLLAHLGILLTTAGAVGLVLKAFTRLRLNFLTCQNVKDFGNNLCPSPPGAGRGLARFWRRWFTSFGTLAEELLALSFVPFALTEACQIVTLIESLAIKVQPEIDALVLSIEGFVCDKSTWLPSAIEPSDLARGASLPSGL